MDLEVGINDPTYYTRPFTIKTVLNLIPDTDVLEYVCNENEKDLSHLVGKASDEKKLAVKVARQILSKYVGSYTFKNPEDANQLIHFNVTLDADTLFLDVGGKDKQELIALSETTFSMMGIRIDFAPDHLIFHIVEGDMKAPKDK